MGSMWLDMGSYLVRMKRTGSRKLSKCLPDLWDTIKIPPPKKNQGNPGNPGNPYIPYISYIIIIIDIIGKRLVKEKLAGRASLITSHLRW